MQLPARGAAWLLFGLIVAASAPARSQASPSPSVRTWLLSLTVDSDFAATDPALRGPLTAILRVDSAFSLPHGASQYAGALVSTLDSLPLGRAFAGGSVIIRIAGDSIEVTKLCPFSLDCYFVLVGSLSPHSGGGRWTANGGYLARGSWTVVP